MMKIRVYYYIFIRNRLWNIPWNSIFNIYANQCTSKLIPSGFNIHSALKKLIKKNAHNYIAMAKSHVFLEFWNSLYAGFVKP